MSKIIGNLLYGQSGGPTSIINTSAYYLFKEALKHKEINKIYTLHYGIEGIINNDLREYIDSNEYKKLLTTPGAYFGSNRYKLHDEETDKEVYELILNTFKKYNIRYFFYNGGNDSMDTINKISKYLRKNNYDCYCIGINKTIDNDLCETDFSLGYASAAKFIINTVLEIYADDMSYSKGRVNIIETMGRNAGWLSASAKLCELKGAKVDMIFVPENPLDLNSFLEKVKNIYEKKHHMIIVTSEGIKDKNGKFIFESESLLDQFGHNQLGGVSINLANLIKEKLGYKTRYYELSLLQRANVICKSKIEEKIAKEVSSFAVKSALKGISDKVVIIKANRDNGYKYKLDLVNIDKISNKERFLPSIYIDKENDYIKDEFIDYLLPLVDGIDGLIDIMKY